MARPRDERKKHVYLVKLILREGEDDDLIDMLADCPNRALLVKRALRGANVSTVEIDESENFDDIMDDLLL